jgi:hypothetical protein
MRRPSYPLFAILAAAWLALAGAPVPAAAEPVEPGQEGELGKILAPVPDAKVCFARIYDAAHLASHPAQQVTAMVFQLEYIKFDPDEFYPQGQRDYYFIVSANLRGKEKPLFSAGECSLWDSGIFCGVDDDGGGLRIARAAGNDGITVGFDPQIDRLRMVASFAGEEGADGYELTPGANDKEFHLDRVDQSMCKGLSEE